MTSSDGADFLNLASSARYHPGLQLFVTGGTWAAWHLPIFIVGRGGISFPLFLLILVGVSLIMAPAFNASGQALIVVILMHSD